MKIVVLSTISTIQGELRSIFVGRMTSFLFVDQRGYACHTHVQLADLRLEESIRRMYIWTLWRIACAGVGYGGPPLRYVVKYF